MRTNLLKWSSFSTHFTQNASFYTKGLIFPNYDISWDLKVCSSTINEEISPSILLNMDLMGNGICNSRTIVNI